MPQVTGDEPGSELGRRDKARGAGYAFG